MSEVTMIKNGELISVDESCVSGHREVGWAVAEPEQVALATNNSSLAELLERVAVLEAENLELKATIAKGTGEGTKEPTKAELQAALDAAGIPWTAAMPKAELTALLPVKG